MKQGTASGDDGDKFFNAHYFLPVVNNVPALRMRPAAIGIRVLQHVLR